MPKRAKKEKRPVPKIDFKPYGAAIKAGRKKQNESRNKAGSDMFLSPRYLSNIENKGQQPSLQVFLELVSRYHIEPHAAVQRDGPLLLVQPGHGVERVFQSVGQNGAQLGVWNAQRCGEAELRRQPDAVLLRLFRKRGAQQIDQLVFTAAPEATR